MSKFEPDSFEQMTWDNILVKGWFANSNINIMAVMFAKQFGNDALARVRRAPNHPRHYGLSATRFAAAYLPKLSAKLFDGMTQQEALFALLGSAMDTQVLAADSTKLKGDKKMIRNSINLSKKTDKDRMEWKDKFQSHRVSNQWGVCK